MKTLSIAFKDTLIRFRDRNAILLMLVAPLIMAFIMGLAFGNQTANDVPLRDIPIILVNADLGNLGAEFLTVLEPENLDGLFAPSSMTDLDEAKTLIEEGQVRGVVYIPADFSQALEDNNPATNAQVMVFTDPAAAVTPFILESVVEQIAGGFSVAAIAQEVVTNQLAQNAADFGAVAAQIPVVVTEEFETTFAKDEPLRQHISMGKTIMGGEPGAETINLMGYFAPSMAIFFLMFTLFDGTRSILEEENKGTLARLITTPTSFSQIILGKIGGTFLSGILQFAVLVAASALFFKLDWGVSPLGLVLMVLATVTAATSLGAAITAFARNINQAGIIGSVIALAFAVLGGNFATVDSFPDWLTFLSKLTINRWALDGFVNLTLEKLGVVAILPNLAVLFGLGIVFFTFSLITFRKRFVR